MKYLLCSLLILLISVSGHSNPGTDNKPSASTEGSFAEQAPFNFMNPVPSRIKLKGDANLSFFVNGAIVFQYRFRVECPPGGESSVDKSLLSWSPWMKDDIKNIRIAQLVKDGRYVLAIEYRTHTSSDIRRFEKSFEVYDPNPPLVAEKAAAKTVITRNSEAAKEIPAAAGTGNKVPVNENVNRNMEEDQSAKAADASKNDIPAEKKAEPKPVAPEKPVGENKPVITEKPASTEKPVSENKPVIAEKTSAADKPVNNDNPAAGKPLTSGNQAAGVTAEARDYDKLLSDAIGKRDPGLIREMINASAGKNLRDVNGGTVFHLLTNNIVNEDLITFIKNKGFSINEADDYGNTPLHFALLKGDNQYAKALVNQGANIVTLNRMELSPLHLATYLNNTEIIKEMMKKGIKVDIRGNTGYTPLHIATEMNHTEIASIFLNRGASEKLKTGQRLNSKDIASIQKDQEMKKLIAKKGKYSPVQSMSTIPGNKSLVKIEGSYPQIDFNLPYDSQMAKRRQLFSLIQKISVPVFVIGAAGTAYLHLTANGYYSKYQSAETEDIALSYYNKTIKFDNYTKIAGGVSLIPVYTFIHSTILKNSTSKKMRKPFN